MLSTSYKASAVQMNSGTNVDNNLEQARRLIKQAADEGAKVIGLPENFAFLGGLSMRIERAGDIMEKAKAFLRDCSREFGIYLLGGSYPRPAGEGRVYNHSAFYGPDGTILASYDKIHLFDVTLSEDEAYVESDYIRPGRPEPAVYQNESIGNWGLSVCYDLRFPEYYRQVVSDGAEILAIPSAFTYTTGRDHWLPLLQARAIENTSYVFAPAQTGHHGKDRKTWGHAMLVDPWGEVLSDAGTEPGLASAHIDGHRLAEVRRAIPSLQHRRL